MSAIVRRRRARRNSSSSVGSAIGTDALFALVGGGIGAAEGYMGSRSAGAIAGAAGGLALATIGGLVVALVSKPLREQALVTSGVGLAGIIVLRIIGNVTNA